MGMTQMVFLNNSFIPSSEATIPIADRGFRFGDGIFETIAIQSGKAYQWKRHLARLNFSLASISLQIDTALLEEKSKQLIKMNNAESGLLRICITRGEGGSGYLPKQGQPTVLIETFSAFVPPVEPVDLWQSSYEKISPSALPVEAKTMQGLNSTLARMEAEKHDCFEALLCRDGIICEGSSSNIFWAKQGKLFTPSLECGLLPGVMRELVIEHAPCEVVESMFTLSDLLGADEVFLTNVSWKLLTVERFMPVGIIFKQDSIRQQIMQALELS